MIEKCEYEINEITNPRTKKQIQILLSRNVNGDKEIKKKSNLIEFAKDQSYQSIYSDDKSGTDELSPTKGCESGETRIKNFVSLEENSGDRSSFEEIENKLEEMFAGIDDENLTSIPAEKGSNEISLSFNKEEKSISKLSNMVMLPCDSYSQNISSANKSSLPTKAAMKSTVSFPKNTSPKNKECTKKSKSLQHLRKLPMRRRLSIGMDSELFKFPLRNSEFENVVNCSSSKKLTLQKSKVIKAKDCDTPKYKIKKSNVKGCIKYKDNKQRQNKSDSGTTKHKFKQGQRFLPSDNYEEFEEKNQQTREIDKSRSPFILVTNKGNVTVVNTMMQDEFNEKYTKTKVSKSYVFERKTVKGCHSSTLSNRYDAHKADSSWICVFCKKGPHKKGLGDLFGPYVISTDCDEYKSYKDLIEFSSKNGKTELPFLAEVSTNGPTSCNQTVKHLCNDSVKSQKYHALDISKHAENIFPNYSLGMKKISECSYEIWIHEDCAIWAPNIFIIGSRLTGLEEATWNSTSHECRYCSKPGALICCLQRDCKIMAHLPCAREVNWLLDESSFLTLCKHHFKAKYC